MRRADRTSIFWSGGWQAVRLPKEYLFEGTEVRIRRRGAAVILEPVATDWRWLDELATAGLDDDFVEAALERPADQERDLLD